MWMGFGGSSRRRQVFWPEGLHQWRLASTTTRMWRVIDFDFLSSAPRQYCCDSPCSAAIHMPAAAHAAPRRAHGSRAAPRGRVAPEMRSVGRPRRCPPCLEGRGWRLPPTAAPARSPAAGLGGGSSGVSPPSRRAGGAARLLQLGPSPPVSRGAARRRRHCRAHEVCGDAAAAASARAGARPVIMPSDPRAGGPTGSGKEPALCLGWPSGRYAWGLRGVGAARLGRSGRPRASSREGPCGAAGARRGAAAFGVGGAATVVVDDVR